MLADLTGDEDLRVFDTSGYRRKHENRNQRLSALIYPRPGPAPKAPSSHHIRRRHHITNTKPVYPASPRPGWQFPRVGRRPRPPRLHFSNALAFATLKRARKGRGSFPVGRAGISYTAPRPPDLTCREAAGRIRCYLSQHTKQLTLSLQRGFLLKKIFSLRFCTRLCLVQEYMRSQKAPVGAEEKDRNSDDLTFSRRSIASRRHRHRFLPKTQPRIPPHGTLPRLSTHSNTPPSRYSDTIPKQPRYCPDEEPIQTSVLEQPNTRKHNRINVRGGS